MGAVGTVPTSERIPTGSAPGWTMYDHGVNNAMATKGGAVWYRQSFDEADARQSYTRLELQQEFHGQVTCPHTPSFVDELYLRVEILSERSSLSPGKRLHHQRSSRHAMVPLSDTSPHPEG